DGANCIAEIEGNTLKAIYVHGVEMISKRDISGTLYYLYDNIGNTVATINWDGTVNTRYEYDAFGKVRSETPSGDTRNKNKFVGGHGIVDDSDDDGLIYMRARYYDSEIGRFISRDPIGILGGLNLYVYCDNNPINYVDPFGNCKKYGNLDDAQRQKVQDAIDRLRDIGLNDMADRLQNKLDTGLINNGAKSEVDPLNPYNINLGDSAYNQGIDNLAGTLAHEYIHTVETETQSSYEMISNSLFGGEGTAGSSTGDMVREALIRQRNPNKQGGDYK
ncbi:MAG: RHS repeat-associated core domain-containing protein, partial [Candidatus Woesearchaeota archaeon]